jgi:uncharacterized membrane protein
MQARAKFLGHPIHQMLIAFPLGGLGAAVIFDIVGLVTGAGRWSEIAFWMILFGILSGAAAAVFGLIDWLAIPQGTRARRLGAWHGGGNALVLLLFAGSLFLRWPTPTSASALALLLAFLGFGVAGITGWMGGELVDRLGVGVHEGAHLDAPSSLGHQRNR